MRPRLGKKKKSWRNFAGLLSPTYPRYLAEDSGPFSAPVSSDPCHYQPRCGTQEPRRRCLVTGPVVSQRLLGMACCPIILFLERGGVSASSLARLVGSHRSHMAPQWSPSRRRSQEEPSLQVLSDAALSLAQLVLSPASHRLTLPVTHTHTHTRYSAR